MLDIFLNALLVLGIIVVVLSSIIVLLGGAALVVGFISKIIEAAKDGNNKNGGQ